VPEGIIVAHPVYVEILIRAPMDDVWRLTQDPREHARWDLRFSDIQYLPRPDESEPQQFLYTTRIGFGLEIQGTGSSVGSSDGTRGRTSALQFGSNDRKSLIRDGSGYWQYQPRSEGVRFLTRYGYRVRFGPAGEWFDRLVFRPLIGWATAWSFDCLRLWLEKGVTPEAAIQRSVIHTLARTSLAVVWIYHGLVPKLLFPEHGELELLQASGLFRGYEPTMLAALGIAEIAFGLAMLLLWRIRRIFLLNIILLTILPAGAAVSHPEIFAQPFNPATLSIALIALAIIGYLSARDIPTAASCIRREPGETE
jgi:hypothetical protein